MFQGHTRLWISIGMARGWTAGFTAHRARIILFGLQDSRIDVVKTAEKQPVSRRGQEGATRSMHHMVMVVT